MEFTYLDTDVTHSANSNFTAAFGMIAPYYQESAKKKKRGLQRLLLAKSPRQMSVRQTSFEKGVCGLTKRISDYLNDCFHRCAQDMSFPACLQQRSRQVRQKKRKRKYSLNITMTA